MSDKSIPRVLRVEHCERDKRFAMRRGMRTASYRDWTEADVMTPFGEVHVKLPGFFAERRYYPKLIELAMYKAWSKFCNV